MPQDPAPDSVGRHLGFTDPERLAVAMERALEEMESRTLSSEELALFRAWMKERERMAWAREVFRAYWPWVVTIGGAFAAVVVGIAKSAVWFADHFQWVKSP